MADRTLIYVADVMCSWCWGFAPALAALEEATGMPVELVQGGLAPGEQGRPAGPKMTEFLRGCWTQVHEASGQPFAMEGLEKPEGWVYDTEPPAMAVATLRAQAPGEELAFFHRLQEAFYARNIDVTDPASWPALLPDGIDADTFVAAATGPAAKKAAWTEFIQARKWGVSGFPALIVRDGAELALVTQGWAPTKPLVEAVTGWLETRGAPLDGDVCATDGTGC